MNLITGDLFAAYLRCPLKCFMLSRGKKGSGNAYSEWFRREEEAYFDEYVYATGLTVRTSNLEAVVHLVQRVPSDGRSQDRLVPSRLTFANKLTHVDS